MSPAEPNKRLTVQTRSLAHRRPERQADSGLDLHAKPIAARDSEIAAGFDLLARFLLATTSASGVAVAVVDETGLHCRASAGEAPQPGTPIRMENTLSGQCIRTAATLYCDDTLVKCPNALPARSILLLPIKLGRKVRGLVALFSRQPQAYPPATAAIARSAAVLMETALNAWSPQLDGEADEQVLEIDIPEPAAFATPAPATTELRPACSPTPAATAPRPRKRLIGLPCAKCGAYFGALETRCSVCNTPR